MKRRAENRSAPLTVQSKVAKSVGHPKSVSQAKPVCQLKRAPTAPPVYRPQPTPKVLQRKTAPGAQQTSPITRQTASPGRSPVVQQKPIANTVFVSRLTPHRAAQTSLATQGLIQRAEGVEGRPRRNSANYNFNYTGPSDLENLTAFVRLAKAHIAQLKRTVTVQPYRNLAQAARGEETKAFLCIRMNGHVLGEGCSGGNQHGEIRCLDSVGWDAGSQGNQYYFVCDGGKESCYLCSAIASLLKIAVAATDDSTYGDYVAPSCLQTDDDLWKSFIGKEAFELWESFGGERRSKLRLNLGWVHNLGLYWQ